MGTGAPAAGGFDVVVVGGGAAGVLVALRLATGGGPPPRVAIVEPGARLGEGVAYSTTQPVHLLNVPAARMSAFEERPGHFVDFLAGRSRVPHARLGAEFAPRALFAQYLRATLEALPAAAAPAHLRASATDLERDGAGWRVHLSSGAALPARAVVLATGNAPRRIPPFLLHPGARAVEAWDYEAVAAIPDGADTCILGTGLSMVDAALVLGRPGRRGHLMALSRRGLAPLAHAPGGPPAAGDVDDLLALGVRARMRLLRRRAAAGDEPWQWTMDRLRPHGQALWRSLDPAEQRRFLRHAVRWWDIHRHRIAPDVAARIARLRAEGRLELVAGRLRAVTPHPQGGSCLHVRPRHGLHEHTRRVDWIVNASGVETGIELRPGTLLQAMRARGLAIPGRHGLGLACDDAGRVLDRRARALPGLFAIGALRIGDLWETTAIPELRVQARGIADAIRAGAATVR